MNELFAAALFGVSFAIMYLAFVVVIALVFRVPFKVVAKFWKSYKD